MWKNKDKWAPPRNPIEYLKWTVVKNIDTGEHFLIFNSNKKKFISERAMLSWRYRVIKGTTQSLSKFILNGKLGFRSGTIVRVAGTGKQYIIIDNKYKLIATPDFYTDLNIDPKDVVEISLAELEFHEKGEDINGTI